MEAAGRMIHCPRADGGLWRLRVGRREAVANEAKHGVSFKEAASVFLDVDYLLLPDALHEGRYLALGFSKLARLLIVVHIERGPRVRLISARRASRRERETYERRKAAD
jgi:uncharacterized DUF497 family protein